MEEEEMGKEVRRGERSEKYPGGNYEEERERSR